LDAFLGCVRKGFLTPHGLKPVAGILKRPWLIFSRISAGSAYDDLPLAIAINCDTQPGVGPTSGSQAALGNQRKKNERVFIDVAHNKDLLFRKSWFPKQGWMGCAGYFTDNEDVKTVLHWILKAYKGL
jgi:hypothetical protein